MGQQWVNDFSLQLEKNIEFGKDDNVSNCFIFFSKSTKSVFHSHGAWLGSLPTRQPLYGLRLNFPHYNLTTPNREDIRCPPPGTCWTA